MSYLRRLRASVEEVGTSEAFLKLSAGLVERRKDPDALLAAGASDLQSELPACLDDQRVRRVAAVVAVGPKERFEILQQLLLLLGLDLYRLVFPFEAIEDLLAGGGLRLTDADGAWTCSVGPGLEGGACTLEGRRVSW